MSTAETILVQLVICVAYVISVKAVELWVKSFKKDYTPPSWLKPVEMVHNIALSGVSLGMAIVMITHLHSEGRFNNFESMACINTDNSGIYGLANLVYLLSKIWEWLDTYFLILSGKPVITLHYFHHMTTFTMAAVVHNFPVGGFCFINCIVHFIMYAYYAFPVRWFRVFITSSQLIQFVAVISMHTYGKINSLSSSPTFCFDMTPVKNEWWYCEGVVIGYFILFVKFFINQ